MLKARTLILSLELKEVIFRGAFSHRLRMINGLYSFVVNVVVDMDNSSLYQVQSMRSQSHILPGSPGCRRAVVCLQSVVLRASASRRTLLEGKFQASFNIY